MKEYSKAAAETVTNAFRLGVWLGRIGEKRMTFQGGSHQCLSAGSLVRTSTHLSGSFSRFWVTNAFRLGVWLGPFRGGVEEI